MQYIYVRSLRVYETCITHFKLGFCFLAFVIIFYGFILFLINVFMFVRLYQLKRNINRQKT